MTPFLYSPHPYTGYYMGPTNQPPPPLPSPAFYTSENEALDKTKEDKFEYFSSSNLVIAEAPSDIRNTYSDANTDDNVIVIHEHHHHHHHKNATDDEDSEYDSRESDDNLTHNSDYETEYSSELANPDIRDYVEQLMDLFTGTDNDDYVYEDQDVFFTDDEDDIIRRSAVYAKESTKEETKKYKRIAEIYRDLYSDYYTAYVSKAGYKTYNDAAEDDIEHFIEDGFEPIVEIEIDL